MRKNMWYSMEPAKLTVSMPISVYEKIKHDIKIENEGSCFATKWDLIDRDRDILNFRVKKHDSDTSRWGLSENGVGGWWDVISYLDSVTISSKFKDGNVIAHFSIFIRDSIELDKSESREMILNELV